MGPRYFPPGMTTDQPDEVLVAELVREKVLWFTRDEVPHAIGVAVDELSVAEPGGTSRIAATIYVEHESQRGILVGAGGAMIKRIGVRARHDLETVLGTKVRLDLSVKVKAGWRRDDAAIERFGYGEGG